VAALKACGFCLEPLTGCCCDDEAPAVPPGLAVHRVPAEGGDDPGEPGPELYHIES
jgi:hypothetical protein